LTRLLSMVVGVPLLLLVTAQVALAETCHFPLY
jgi:hypothetical protein